MPNIQVKLRRGTTAQHAGFTGAEGEVTVDTDKDTVVVHDGSTAGGHELRKKSDTIAGSEIDNDAVDTAQIATGAVTHDKISSTDAVFKINSSDQVRIGGNLGDANLESISQVGITSSDQTVLSVESTDTDSTNDNAVVVVQAPGYAALGLYDSNESIANGNGWYNINSVDGKFSIGSLAVGGTAQPLDLIEFARKTISGTDYMVPELENLPTFADNSAATSGGLSINDVYKTSTGELRIVV